MSRTFETYVKRQGEWSKALPATKKCTQCMTPIFGEENCPECNTPHYRELAAEEELPF